MAAAGMGAARAHPDIRAAYRKCIRNTKKRAPCAEIRSSAQGARFLPDSRRCAAMRRHGSAVRACPGGRLPCGRSDTGSFCRGRPKRRAAALQAAEGKFPGLREPQDCGLFFEKPSDRADDRRSDHAQQKDGQDQNDRSGLHDGSPPFRSGFKEQQRAGKTIK